MGDLAMKQRATVFMRHLSPRDPSEIHRSTTPLELFFDLCFVVAVSQAANSMHHSLSEGHIGQALAGFAMVFFGIWWAWMNFTWFASAYDNDDATYRILTLVQITGALILAAGTPRAFDERDFGIVVLGYSVMRVALVIQWIRAAVGDRERRLTNFRYALGITVCQIGWIAILVVPDELKGYFFAFMALGELTVPIFAERSISTPWHPEHIAERYGLFTLIVLGESVIAATLAIQTAIDADGAFADLAVVIIGGLLIMFSMWWLYFSQPARLMSKRAVSISETVTTDTFIWGYGHLVVFAAAAAVGAGLAAVVDEVMHHSALTDAGAGLAVCIPAALFILAVWAIHVKSNGAIAMPVAAGLIVSAGILGLPLVVPGLIMAALVIGRSIADRPDDNAHV